MKVKVLKALLEDVPDDIDVVFELVGKDGLKDPHIGQRKTTGVWFTDKLVIVGR